MKYPEKDVEELRKQEKELVDSLSVKERIEYARIFQKSVFYANKPTCNHKKEVAIGKFKIGEIEILSAVAPQKSGNFEIKEIICCLCGKTVSLEVRKLPKPQKPSRIEKEGKTQAKINPKDLDYYDFKHRG